jgi:hypothetical protein
LQTENTENTKNIFFQPKKSSWVKMKKNNPYLKVHFEIESYKSTDILLPIDLLEHSAIPCHSIVLDNPNTEVSKILEQMRYGNGEVKL